MRSRQGWLVPLIRRIKVRPAMYLGDQTIESLALYLAAFCEGRESLRRGSGERDWVILQDFAVWLARSRFEARLKAWVTLVLERAEKARRKDTAVLFFELFERFAQANRAKRRVIGTRSRRASRPRTRQIKPRRRADQR